MQLLLHYPACPSSISRAAASANALRSINMPYSRKEPALQSCVSDSGGTGCAAEFAVLNEAEVEDKISHVTEAIHEKKD